MTPNQLATLKEHQIKPGTTRNPNGRPPNTIIIGPLLRKYGAMKASVTAVHFLQPKYPLRDLSQATTWDIILLRAQYDAEHGSDAARQFCAERTDGRVTEKLQVSDDTMRPVVTLDISKITPKKLETLREVLRDVRQSTNANIPQ